MNNIDDYIKILLNCVMTFILFGILYWGGKAFGLGQEYTLGLTIGSCAFIIFELFTYKIEKGV